jgi:hypothetical protein
LAAEKQIIGNRKRQSDHTSDEEGITLLETSHENMPSDAIVPVAKELFLAPVTQMNKTQVKFFLLRVGF